MLSVFLFAVILLASTRTGMMRYAWSPTNNYAPGIIECPRNKPIIRDADHILPEEAEFMRNRRVMVKPALVDFFSRANLDFNYMDYISSASLTIGLAFSGGGYRAMLSGAGVFRAIDSRTPGSRDPGRLGGLLQSSAYITGLSGGSWLLASVYMNNFTTIDALLNCPRVWNMESSLLDEEKQTLKNIQVYRSLIRDIINKFKAGFKISLTDIWGRALSRQMIDLEDGGPALQWSDMANWSWFKNGDAPFPIVIANSGMHSTNTTDPYALMVEVTPYEIGSFDPSLYAFADLKYLGTRLNAGSPSERICFTGLDNAGFIFGTSSSVFDVTTYKMVEILRGVFGTSLQSFIDPIIKKSAWNVGVYWPNPFKNYFGKYSVNNANAVSTDQLYLVDGGEDGQVIPLQPLINPGRQVDTIIAFDFDTDTEIGWPNGNSIVKTYSRQFHVQLDFERPIAFPHVPDTNTFVNKGLISRPTFFGCYAHNLTYLGGVNVPPLIVYMANYPYTAFSNTSTLKLSYTNKEAWSLIDNSYNLMTQLNGSLDANWHSCLACAVVQRETERRNRQPSPKCAACLETYCWDGKIDPYPIQKSKHYAPDVIYDRFKLGKL